MAKMRRLDEKQIKRILSELEDAAKKGGRYWDELHKNYSIPAYLEFPLGELMNQDIVGFLWAWKMRNIIEVLPIDEKDRFKAHGIEGKARVKTELITALLAYRDLPPYRRQILA